MTALSVRSLHVFALSIMLAIGSFGISAVFAGDTDSCCTDGAAKEAKAEDGCCSTEAKAAKNEGEAKACCSTQKREVIAEGGLLLDPCFDEEEEEAAPAIRPAGWPRLGIMTAAGYYPVNRCIVTGETLNQDSPKTHVFEHEGRMIALCCPGCEVRFHLDTERFLNNLDTMIRDQQGPDYPLTACAIAGSDLSTKAEPVLSIIDNYLVKLCCKGCESKLKANPDATLTQLKAYWSQPIGEATELAMAE